MIHFYVVKRLFVFCVFVTTESAVVVAIVFVVVIIITIVPIKLGKWH